MMRVTISGIELSKEVPESRFPGWLMEVAEEWNSVLYRGEYVGEVYLYHGNYRVYTMGVIPECTGLPLEMCIKWLINNR